MITLFIGILLTSLLVVGIVKVLRKDPNQDYADKLAKLEVEGETLELRDDIADQEGKLNRKRSKVVNKETKLEKDQ